MEGDNNRRDLVMEIYNFLKNGNLENQVLMKEKKLSILSSHLFMLNRVFATYNSNEIVNSARREAVEFLRDFCFRIPTLKLVHGSQTIQGAIDVSRLHSLTHLEIGRAPVHLLVGLRSLRQQLQVLICTRSLHSIEMLVGKCGGDQAAEENWPHLHTLDLSFNYLTSLDSSLTFLPSLRVLDLSHNQIKNSSHFLECLTELQHLNLSYNCFSRAPPLNQLAQRKLKSLNLRNNNLQYLDDVHLYENLELLELSRNCIYLEQALQPLNSVWQISRINLQGNPIAYEPLYRQLVTKNLPPGTAFRNVYLDGKLLSEVEIKMIPTQRKSVYHNFPTGRDEPASNISKASYLPDISVDSLEESADYSSAGPGRTFRAREKKKKKKKVRQVIISEHAQSEGLPSFTPKSVESTYMEDAKREFEKKREEHGPDWLLSLQEPYKKPAEPINGGNSPNPFLDGGWDQDPPETQSKTKETVETVPDVSKEEYGKDKNEETVEKFVVTAQVEGEGSDEDEAGIEIKTEITGDRSSLRTEDGGSESMLEADNSQMSSGIDLEYDYHTNDLVLTSQELMKNHEENSERKRADSEEDLCGPMLVKVIGDTESGFIDMLVTVKQTHLEESDLNGEVQERLELRSLLSVEVCEMEVPEEGLVPIVELNFEYVRKDRRKRSYYMEDQPSTEILSGILDPFCQENQQKTVTQYMSCLKCSKEFPLSKAIMVVDKPKGRKISDQQDYILSEVPTCPFCGNRYLVEKEHGSTNNGNTTPVVGSLVESSKPLAASSPWRVKENGKMSSSLGQHSSVSPSVYPNSPLTTNHSDSQATIIYPGSTSNLSDNPDDSISSEVFDTSLKLPESTIPDNSIDAKTPIEVVAHYSTDQLDNLLKSDKSDFTNRYSLIPYLSVDASSLQDSLNRIPSTSSQHGPNTKDVKKSEGEEDIYGGKLELSDEDDIDVLEEFQENSKTGQSGLPQSGKGKESELSKERNTYNGRLSSNESDIAVLSDRDHQDTDRRERVDSITSDNVFGSSDGNASNYRVVSSEDEGRRFESSNEMTNTTTGLTASASSDESRKERNTSMLTKVRDNSEVADHRLKLFYSMSLFSSDEEQFQCHTLGSICTSTMLGLVCYEGLVVVSNSHLYVLKIVKEESEKPADFLTKKLQYPLQELMYVHIGLGSQLLQFEYAADGGRFTFLIGDRLNVENFAKVLQDSILEKETIKFEGIERGHSAVKHAVSGLLQEDEDDLLSLNEAVYIHALDPKLKDSLTSNMRQGLLITERNIYLLMENCSWPLIGVKSGKVTTKGKHFTLKEHFSITDVTDVECNSPELKAVINFSDEDNGKESQWELRLLTSSSLNYMLDAINRPWSEQFGVDITIINIDS